MALTLGVWAAACSSGDAPPADASLSAASPSAGNVATGGSAAVGSMNGAGNSTTSGGASADANAAAAVTGAGAAASGAGTTTTGTMGSGGSINTAGTTDGSNNSGSVGTMNATGSMGGPGTGTATTGAATTGSSEPACATRPALATPGLVDFESYDGATAALMWEFEFNDGGMNPLYGGFFDNSDGSGMATLKMVGGDTSTWAVKAANTEASMWGGGIGLWLGCLNASSYTGISLAVRGSTPNQNGVSVALSVNGLTEGVGATIFVTDLFTTFELPFTEFSNEAGETTNGDNIVGLAINAQMMWLQDETTEEWQVIPGAYEIVIDDIAFY